MILSSFRKPIFAMWAAWLALLALAHSSIASIASAAPTTLLPDSELVTKPPGEGAENSAPSWVSNDLSPSAVGWGNLFVPGLGATLRGYPGVGALEAATEIGLFYGGTFGVREGSFTIDTTIVVPQRGGIARPLLGQALQQIGLKLHMYDTFYHYQQASLAAATTEREKNNPQPLYKGTWHDVISAPFKWKNLSNPWVYGLAALTAAYSFYDYRTTSVSPAAYRATSLEEALWVAQNVGIEPLGSSFGEDVLFRGFMQREARMATGSLPLALLFQSTIFTLLHPSEQKLPAFFGGIYFGLLTEGYDGNLEPAIAAHFWVDAISGLFSYLAFRRAQGEGVPFPPPLAVQFGMPLTF